MYIQNVNLDVNAQPDANAKPCLRLSQNENGRVLMIRIIGVDIPGGSTANFAGLKPDGNVYSKPGTVDGNVVSIEEDIQMTAVSGSWNAKITIVNDGNTICTARIRVVVDASVVPGGAIPSDSQLDGIVAECQAYAESAKSAAYGSPLTASTAADMTDQDRVYVYTGSESGYTSGHWYYWDGTAWTDGGVYNSVAVDTDTTLSISGKAADAKATGDEISELKSGFNELKEDLTDLEESMSMPPESIDATTLTNINIAENGDKWYAVNGYNTQYVSAVAGKKLSFTIVPNRTGDFRFGFSSAVPAHQTSATYLGKLGLTGTTSGTFEYTPQADGYVGCGYYSNLLDSLTVMQNGDSIVEVVTALQTEIEDFDVETDKTLTVSDKPADAKVAGDRIMACEEWIHGEAQTATPTDVSNINLATNATKYSASNGYTTSYIPVRAFEKWTFTAVTVRSAAMRYGFTKAIPANQVPATWLYTSDRTGVVTDEYTYIPTEDGYFTVSYYYNVLSSLTASGYDGGAEKEINDNAADIDALEGIVAPINTSADFRRTQTHHETLRLVKNAQSSYKNQSSPLTLIHFSDIHGDTAALARIKADVADLGYNDIICTGDMVATTNSEIASWWDADVLTCIGNHDAATNNGGWVYDALPMSDRDAYYIAPFESGWGITHTSGTSYYYKDYATQKVRLIVLDSQLYLSDNTDATAQTAWLTNLLADAKTNNLHVIIAIHGAAEIALYVDCSFTKAGATHTGYDEMSNTPQAVVDAVESAISGGTKFVCYIVGHVHQDGVFKPTNSQLGFEVTCANSANIAQWYYSDQYRSDTEDAYNVVVVDTKNTLVRVIRGGGADVDNLMRARKGICFNYSTGAKVGEIL